jgi:hypothetical protein
MTDQFQHVMVLTSIIIGLGITHLLLGFSAAIDRITMAILFLIWQIVIGFDVFLLLKL